MDFWEDLSKFHVSAKEIPCLTGRGAPTKRTEGVPGVLYMDTDTGGLYKCRGGKDGAYRWELQGGSAGLTDADKAELAAMVLDALAGKVITGYVDESNNIVINGLPDGSYTVKYEMADGSTVDIGALELDSNVYYSITNTLTNCVNSNGAVRVVAGGSYEATITANAGYELESVAVTMGGAAVTVSGGSISIASVTGDIVITAVAAEIQTGGYTNLADPASADWQEGYRLSLSSGNPAALAGHTTTNFIPCKMGDVLRVKGMRMTGYINGSTSDVSDTAKILAYNSSKTKVAGLYGLERSGNSEDYGLQLAVDGDIKTYTVLQNNNGAQKATSSTAYIRIDGALEDGYTANDVIITINEQIG